MGLMQDVAYQDQMALREIIEEEVVIPVDDATLQLWRMTFT